jgi:hypothetical protein
MLCRRVTDQTLISDERHLSSGVYWAGTPGTTTVSARSEAASASAARSTIRG